MIISEPSQFSAGVDSTQHTAHFVRTGGSLGPAGSVFTWSVAAGGILDFTGFYPDGTLSFGSQLAFDYEAAFRLALDQWSSAANIEFIEVPDPGTEFGGLFQPFPDIRIGFGALDAGGANGFATFPFAANSGHVWLNSSAAGFWTPQTLFFVAMHEIGHVLGLDHTPLVNAVMNAAADPAFTGLQSDDIAGIQNIYGPQDNGPNVYSLAVDRVDLTLIDGAPDLTIIGNSLSNTITGSANGERIVGGSGADILRGMNGNDRLEGGVGNDILDGGGGFDTTDYSTALQAITANIGGGTAIGADVGTDTLIGIENIAGGAGDDTVFGDDGTNVLNGGAGNDTLVGNANIFAQQADILDGGAGNDTVYGEFTDAIIGGTGTDFLYAVNDFAWSIDLGATSIEWMFAGSGNDTINAATQTAGVEIFASGGADTVTGSAQGDTLWAGVGNDVVSGGGGDDMLFGDLGSDSLSGGDGNDRIYADSTDSLIDGGAGTDAVYITSGPGMSFNMATQGIEFVADFAGGNDTLNGAGLTVDMTAYAGGGIDVITGGAGNDFLWGEGGDDILTGNNGNDVLVGGIGADVMTGGTGIDVIYMNSGGGSDGVLDRVVFTTGWGTDFVFDFVAGQDKLDLSALGTNFAALSITNSFGHAYIHIGAGTDLIAVANNGGLLTAGDFVF